MAYRSILLRKLSYIKSRYGEAAATYFKEHPYCEECPERRLACLTLHHPEGRSVNIFKTLCFNCHMLTHASNSRDATFEDEKKWLSEKRAKRLNKKERDKESVKLIKQGFSLRQVAERLEISHVTVWYAAKEANVRSGLKNHAGRK